MRSSTDDVSASFDIVKFYYWSRLGLNKLNSEHLVSHGDKTLAIFIPDTPLEDDYLRDFKSIASGL